MKKQLILIGALLMSSFIYAQHGGKHGDASEKMKSELSLTDPQYQSIKTIEEQYSKKQQLLRKDSTLSRDKKSQAMRALWSERNKEVQTVLTPEQKTKWAAYRKSQSDKGKAHMQKSSEKFSQKMKAELSLTDDQFAKFQQVNTDFRKKLSEVRKETADKALQKDAYKKLKAEYESSMKSALTAEQFQKWMKLRSEMGKKSHGHGHSGDHHDRRG